MYYFSLLDNETINLEKKKLYVKSALSIVQNLLDTVVITRFRSDAVSLGCLLIPETIFFPRKMTLCFFFQNRANALKVQKTFQHYKIN